MKTLVIAALPGLGLDDIHKLHVPGSEQDFMDFGPNQLIATFANSVNGLRIVKDAIEVYECDVIRIPFDHALFKLLDESKIHHVAVTPNVDDLSNYIEMCRDRGIDERKLLELANHWPQYQRWAKSTEYRRHRILPKNQIYTPSKLIIERMMNTFIDFNNYPVEFQFGEDQKKPDGCPSDRIDVKINVKLERSTIEIEIDPKASDNNA